MKKLLLPLLAILLTAACKKESTLQSSPSTNNSSMDDAVTGTTGGYSWVRIGTQRWMTRNLDVTHYRNGDKIPRVGGKAAWAALTTGAWCWYNNDSAMGAVYGRLYNWYAVNDPRGLAPTGWHVPTDAEWDTLSTHLGSNAGGKLKDTGTIEAGTGLWYAPNLGATNHTGFTGLPGGYRQANNPRRFRSIGNYGLWWSSTEIIHIDRDAWTRLVTYDNGSIDRFYSHQQDGLYVRCIKD